MTGLEPVAKALIAGAAKPVVDKLKRQERVVALLKTFKLAPQVPPRDFDGVYVYTLSEYCYGKPKPIINFFRNEYVRDAFRKTFETGDPSHLDREAEEIMQWNDETGELGRGHYDFRREFAGFTAMFNALVDRTRGAAEARSDLRQEQISHDLQTMLAKLHNRVVALPSLEEIRTVAMTPAAGQLDPVGWLGNEVKGWFDAIGYPFEHYEKPSGESFVWIINVPARRGRYDRIVVFGTVGEAGISDVSQVRALVDSHKADEGWILAPRRVSAAARQAAEATNGTVACYTLDELIDQDADFDPYLDWLEEEVKRRKIDTRYVQVYCRKDEYDPASGKAIAHSIYGADSNGLEGYALGWLTDPSKEHLSVLGEFGTGKSWSCLHLAWELAKQYRTAKRNGLPRPRLPLLIPLRDYAKAVPVESLFSEFFFRRHKVQLSHYSVFEYLNRAGRLLLIFDGFDEMASRVDRQARINNFWELAKVVVPGAKVLLTCRTEHFPEAKESRDLLSAQLKASTQALTGEPPQFEVAELIPFDDHQVRELLGHIAEPAKVNLIMSNTELLDLMRRPVMSELVIDALPDIAEGKDVDIARVYLYAVRRKMTRDIQAERTFTSMGDKLFFLCELSWEMLSTDTMSMNYRQFPDRIRSCFGAAVSEDKDLDHWHHDMLGQSMLIRNADGDYTPAHRSLLEFFVAYKLVAELGLLAPDFLELVKEDGQPDGVTERWSEHFRRLEPAAELKPINSFSPEPIERLATTFGSIAAEGAVVDLMLPMLDRDRSRPALLQVIGHTRGRAAGEVEQVGGNAASLLVQIDPGALRGADLTGAHLVGARLGLDADLSEADLRGAELAKVDFASVVLVDADLTGTDLSTSPNVGFGLDHPMSLTIDPTSNDLFVGTTSGTLLRWRDSRLTTPPETLFRTDRIQMVEFLGTTGKLVLLDPANSTTMIIDAELGTVEHTFSQAQQCELLVDDGVQGVAVMSDPGKMTAYRVEDWNEIGQLELGWALGYSQTLGTTVLARSANGTTELYSLDLSDTTPRRIIHGSHPTTHSALEIAFSGERIWRWVYSGRSGVEVSDVHANVSKFIKLAVPDRAHQPWLSGYAHWVAANPDADAAIITNDTILRAFSLSTWEVLWTDDLVVNIVDLHLTSDGMGVVTANRYGEIVLRDLRTGVVRERTSINHRVRGARFSRDCGISEGVLATLAVSGAVVVD